MPRNQRNKAILPREESKGCLPHSAHAHLVQGRRLYDMTRVKVGDQFSAFPAKIEREGKTWIRFNRRNPHGSRRVPHLEKSGDPA